MKFATRNLPFFAVLLTFITVGVSFARLRLGVDLQDEPYAIALAYRFVRGSIPLVDENSVFQLSALLTYPFFRAFYSITGSSAGIVYFSRLLYLGFSVALAGITFCSFRRKLDWPWALLIALVCVAQMPGGVPFLGYNALGAGFFTIGLLIGFSRARPAPASTWAASAAAHFLAVWSYPPLLIAVLATFALRMVWEERGRRKRAAAIFCGCSLGLALVGIGWLTHLHPERLMDVIRFARIDPSKGGGLHKFGSIGYRLLLSVPHPGFAVPLLSALAILTRYRRSTGLAIPILLALLPIWLFGGPLRAPQAVVMSFALMGPYLFWFTARGPRDRDLLITVWAPSFLAGIITAFTSSNSAPNFSIGSIGAFLCSITFLIEAIRDRNWEFSEKREGSSIIGASAATFIIGSLLAHQYRFIYAETTVASLTDSVQGGPFDGLRTTSEKRQFIESFGRDIVQALRSVERFPAAPPVLLVFNAFPAGYLFTALKPAPRTLWIPQEEAYGATAIKNFVADDFSRRIDGVPHLSVQMLRRRVASVAETISYAESDRLVHAVRGKDRILIARDEYVFSFGDGIPAE